MRRRGFTLIEVLLAMVLAGLVALLVWSIVGAVVEGRERVERVQAEVRVRAALRAVLQDALRHAVLPVAPGERALVLEDGTSSTGLAHDRLTFVTAGGLSPLTPEAHWSVVLEVTQDGLELRATPQHLARATPLIVREPGVDRLEVLALDDGGAWRSSWRNPVLPRGVALAAGSGAAGVVQLVVALPVGGAGR